MRSRLLGLLLLAACSGNSQPAPVTPAEITSLEAERANFANVPEVVGEHFVHGASFFHRSFKYIDRQRNLARVQAKVVRELGLPKWMYVYPLGRYTYAYFPTGLKRVLRRTLGGSREKDL